MRIMLFCVLAIASALSFAQEDPRYFGYYANNGNLSENSDHVNITHIGVWTKDKASALNTLIAELRVARQKGVKAMISVDPFLFKMSSGSGDRPLCPYVNEPASGVHWNHLVSRLVSEGYLVPGDPAASTVAAFYPVDEPEDCGLQDENAAAHPALLNAIGTIRADNRTRDVPIAVIASTRYGKTLRGLRLFDWAGLDCYQCGNLAPWRDPTRTRKNVAYLEEANLFWSRLASNGQRKILVPQASEGGMMREYGYAHSPTFMYVDVFLQDPDIVMLMPFLWKHAETTGVSGLSDLKADYNTIGHMIRNDARIVRQSVPSVMTAGESYTVSFEVKNIGTTTWVVGGNYRLISIGANWGLSGIGVSANVKPGQTHTFRFTARAPSQPGRYGFQWQMERKGLVKFGQPSSRIAVQVNGSGGGNLPPPPTGGTCDPRTGICTEIP